MQRKLLLDVEVRSFPQTLDNQLLAFRAAVDVLDVICKTLTYVCGNSELCAYQW